MEGNYVFEWLFVETANFVRKAPFKEATAKDHLQKLINEAKEAKEAPDDITEYADCLICIMAAAYKAGISSEELMVATSQKLQKVKRLKWKKQPDGTFQSIKSDFKKIEQ